MERKFFELSTNELVNLDRQGIKEAYRDYDFSEDKIDDTFYYHQGLKTKRPFIWNKDGFRLC